MLSGIFNYDNSVWRFIGKFADLIILNILWIVFSIPIFTIGASTTAVYYVTLKLVRDEDGYTVKSFIKSFRENFKQSTIIWLILLAVGMILGIDIYFFAVLYPATGTLKTVMMAVFMALAIIYLAVSIYVFPLQARFYNTIKKTILNAFFMSVHHCFRTIAMIVINVGLVILGFVFMISPILMIFVLFGFTLLAFINSYILSPALEKYVPKAEEDSDELRPLFEDDDNKTL